MPFHFGDHPTRLRPASGLIAKIGMEPAYLVRRSSDRAREQIGDPVLQDLVRWQPDRIPDPLRFKKFVNLGIGKGGVSPKIDARDFVLVARYDGLQHRVPAIGAVNVAGAKGTAFQITELVEHEQWVIAGAGVIAVPDAILLRAMGRAHTRIHVEHDATGRPSTVHKIDPFARQVGKSRKVLGCREPLRFKAPHLARRSRTALNRPAADNPAHRRIVPQPLGVIHILVSGETTKYRLSKQPGQCIPAILASACIGQRITRHHGQADRIVEFAISEQPRIRGHHGTAKTAGSGGGQN